jgi:hypothetical protein
LWTVINNTDDETQEVKASIPAANKAYFSLQTTFLSKQIHSSIKIIFIQNINKTRTVLWKCNLDRNINGSTNGVYVWKVILRRIYGPIQDEGHWCVK